MELCDKYKIYCPFYKNKECKEDKNVCNQWRETYSIFQEYFNNKSLERLEKILKEKK